MADASPSLTQHVQPIDAGAPVMAAAFLDGAPTLALVDGGVLIGEPGAARRVEAHPGAGILVATADGATLLTGGDDGRVVATGASAAPTQIADEKGRWIDAVALRGDAFAWAAGKHARVRDGAGTVKSFAAPTTVRGLSFLPKGYRLALAHYNGVSLWFPNAAAEPTLLPWTAR